MNKILHDLAEQYAALYWQIEAQETSAMEAQNRLDVCTANILSARYELETLHKKLHKASA